MFDVSFCQKSIDAGISLTRVNDSMKSFPSGHSQLALFAGLFVFVSIRSDRDADAPGIKHIF